MMSNKPHLRPHQEERQASQITRLFVAILILAIFTLAIALELTGHVVFRGRLILSRGPLAVDVVVPWRASWPSRLRSSASSRALRSHLLRPWSRASYSNVSAGDAVEGGQGVARTYAGAPNGPGRSRMRLEPEQPADI
jgi:hypothetical protein